MPVARHPAVCLRRDIDSQFSGGDAAIPSTLAVMPVRLAAQPAVEKIGEGRVAQFHGSQRHLPRRAGAQDEKARVARHNLFQQRPESFSGVVGQNAGCRVRKGMHDVQQKQLLPGATLAEGVEDVAKRQEAARLVQAGVNGHEAQFAVRPGQGQGARKTTTVSLRSRSSRLRSSVRSSDRCWRVKAVLECQGRRPMPRRPGAPRAERADSRRTR